MDFMTTVKEFTGTPIFPWLGWIIMSALVLILTGSVLLKSKLTAIKKTFGAESLPHWLTLLMIAIWGAIALILTIGLLILIVEIVVTLVTPDNEGDFRFLLAKTTALTAVLGAVVALPFTALRLKLSNEQNRHNQDVLYNEKLDSAIADLHARYQSSENDTSFWKDDIIRRISAIDRLEILAIERPNLANRIVRLLCIYVREVSRENPKSDPFEKVLNKDELERWAADLIPRPDTQYAMHTLDRIGKSKHVNAKKLSIDLSNANLQAMDLKSIKLHNATLYGCALDAADLDWAEFNDGTNMISATMHCTKLKHAKFKDTKLQNAKFIHSNLKLTHFVRCSLQSADFTFSKLKETAFFYPELNANTTFDETSIKGIAFKNADLQNTKNVEKIISQSFGDSSVILTLNDLNARPPKWPSENLTIDYFEKEWARFLREGDSYIPPQHRNPSD